jgi:hypothetical protein
MASATGTDDITGLMRLPRVMFAPVVMRRSWQRPAAVDHQSV